MPFFNPPIGVTVGKPWTAAGSRSEWRYYWCPYLDGMTSLTTIHCIVFLWKIVLRCWWCVNVFSLSRLWISKENVLAESWQGLPGELILTPTAAPQTHNQNRAGCFEGNILDLMWMEYNIFAYCNGKQQQQIRFLWTLHLPHDPLVPHKCALLCYQCSPQMLR